MDWTGNSNSIYKTLGASNHTDKERQNEDYYATDPIAAKILLEVESLNNVLEPACGEGHLSEVFRLSGVLGDSCDLIDRGYGNLKNILQRQFMFLVLESFVQKMQTLKE